MIEQMRTDFADAARWEDWSEADQAVIGAEIRAASAAHDDAALAYWAWRLATAAEAWRCWRARVREAEVRIKAAAQKARVG